MHIVPNAYAESWHDCIPSANPKIPQLFLMGTENVEYIIDSDPQSLDCNQVIE